MKIIILWSIEEYFELRQIVGVDWVGESVVPIAAVAASNISLHLNFQCKLIEIAGRNNEIRDVASFSTHQRFSTSSSSWRDTFRVSHLVRTVHRQTVRTYPNFEILRKWRLPTSRNLPSREASKRRRRIRSNIYQCMLSAEELHIRTRYVWAD